MRALASFNDLWLDEVWTYAAVTNLKSVAGVFTTLHDNNHPLNTLWMYIVQPVRIDWLYRIPAWLAGIGAVYVGAQVAREQVRRAGGAEGAGSVAAALLIGGCYLLTVYFSEARGYGPAVLAGMLAVWALWRGSATHASGWRTVYWFAIALGLLAHAVMYQVLVAGLVWSAVAALEGDGSRSERVRQVLAWHLVPLVVGLAYYALFLRRIAIGGAPSTTLLDVLARTAMTVMGVPESLALRTLVLLLGAVGVALTLLWRRSRPLVAFYAVVIVLFPIASGVLGRFPIAFPRYLIFSAVFTLLLFAGELGAAWQRGRGARWAVAVVLGLFLLGHARLTAELLRHGRGEYRACIRTIAERTPAGEDIRLASSDDERTVILLGYHAPMAAPGRVLRYVPTKHWRRNGAEWLIMHRLDGTKEAPPIDVLTDEAGNRWERVDAYRHAPLSGVDWYLYRNPGYRVR